MFYMSLSLCMIVKNEEKYLERCLNSVKEFVDEIIIVDTGSTDNTKGIARKFNAKIFDFKWVDDFAAARNFSISKATKDWILVLDADEEIDKENMKKLLELIKDKELYGILIIQRDYTNNKNAFGFKEHKYKNSAGYVPMPIIRIFRNDPRIRYEDRVHETVGNSLRKHSLKFIERPDIFIHHYKEEKGDENKKKRQLKYLRLAQKMIKDNPNHGRAHYFIACISEQYLKDYKQALEHMAKAYDCGFNPRLTLLGLGTMLFNLGKYEKAEEIFTKAIKENHIDPLMYYFLGRINFNKKDYEQAKLYFMEFLRFDTPHKEKALSYIKQIDTPIISYKFKVG